MQEIAPNLYVETDYSPVTVGAALTDEGWVIIDTPPMPQDAQNWREALRKISDQPILYLINTDSHRDRILGNVWFEAPLIAHEAAAQQMLGLKGGFVAQAADDLSSNDNELVAIASLRLVPPQVSFSDALSLYCGNRQIEVLHRPGPSLGSSWVVFEQEQVLFAGDSLSINQHPAITEGISKAWLESLNDLQSSRFAGWTLVPGRGDHSNTTSVEKLIEYLRTMRQRVGTLCRTGRPRSEVGNLLPDLLAYFPYDGFQKDETQRRIRTTLEVVYEEIRSTNGADIAEE